MQHLVDYFSKETNLSLDGESLVHYPFLTNAIKRGASRTVYIGGISESVTPEELRKDFEQYGETEQIRIIRDKNTAFVCFCSIENAIKAIEKAKTDPLYASLKINILERIDAILPPLIKNQIQNIIHNCIITI